MAQPNGTGPAAVAAQAATAAGETAARISRRLLSAANVQNLVALVGIVILTIAMILKIFGVIIEAIMPDNPILAAVFKAVIGLALMFTVAGFAWRKADDQWRDFVTEQPGKGILIGVLLAVGYSGALWFCYNIAAKWVTATTGASPWTSYVLVTILGLPLILVSWRLFQSPTGLPGDEKQIKRGVMLLQVIILVFMGWWYHQVPNPFFDYRTGKSQFYVGVETGRGPFWAKGFNPKTQEKLRLGTKEDAQRLANQPWTTGIWAFVSGWTIGTAPMSPHPNPPPPTQDLPRPSVQKEDFDIPATGEWVLVRIPAGWQNWDWEPDPDSHGLVQIRDRKPDSRNEGVVLHDSRYPHLFDGQLGHRNEFWATSVVQDEPTKIILTRKPR